MWLRVFARGRIVDAVVVPVVVAVVLPVVTEFFRTLLVVATELVLSRRPPFRGRLLGVVVICSFC